MSIWNEWDCCCWPSKRPGLPSSFLIASPCGGGDVRPGNSEKRHVERMVRGTKEVGEVKEEKAKKGKGGREGEKKEGRKTK
jgi:hypothetical protein